MRRILQMLPEPELQTLDLDVSFCEAREEALAPTAAELDAASFDAPETLEIPTAMTDDHAFWTLERLKEREAARAA